MKKYGSALGPAARLTVWKVLGISLLAAGVHCLLFLTALNGWDVVNLGTPSLESVVWMGKLNRVFRVGLLLVCAVLALPWQERGTRTGYTLRRLSVNERVLVLLWGGLNALLLLIFWGVQTAVVLALSQHYLHRPGRYRQPSVPAHRLLPLPLSPRPASPVGLAGHAPQCGMLRRPWAVRRRPPLPLAARAEVLDPASPGGAGFHFLPLRYEQQHIRLGWTAPIRLRHHPDGQQYLEVLPG